MARSGRSTPARTPRLLGRRAALGIPAALGAASLAGCQLNPFQRPVADQVLHTWLYPYQTLDPIHTQGALEAEYVVHIFSGLTGLNEKLEVIPDLAEKWQVSQDGRVYTFTLKKTGRFHDGREVRAADVKYSLERAADPANRSPVAATYLGDIEGLAERLEGKAQEISGLKVRDELTVEITLVEPRVYFPAKLTYPVSFVVDRANVESGGPRWWTRPNGSGPFRVREARPDESLILARHDGYHGPKASLTEVQFAPVPPLAAYEAGQLDVALVELADIERVTDKSDPLSRELHVRTDLDVQYLGFNVTAKPFDDPQVRQAFNHALDREKIASVTLKKTVVKAEGVLPPGMPGRSQAGKALDFDVSRARQLIAESSYRDVRNFPEIVLSIAGNRTQPPPEVNAIVATYKQNLGVDIRVRQFDRNAFLDTTSKRKEQLQMFFFGWLADYADPQNFLDVLFHSRSNENSCLYNSPDVDRLLERARVERDHGTRMRLYQEAEGLIVRDAPWVPLWHSKRYVLVKPYVHGYSAPTVALPWLRPVSLTSNPPRTQPTPQG
ncbi:MAG TPA: peptide ABC transporter substrate-binding protein [Chloroflexota bacterium]|nr:peptide ABC transporter substrate-binding protein [Chloroflexota bacterium]